MYKNIHHSPRGGDKKIFSQKLDFKDKAKPKVGSTEKLHHTPGGGDKPVYTQKLEFKDKAKPKVGSLEVTPFFSPKLILE
jgi:microtubule-associated protein tau